MNNKIRFAFLAQPDDLTALARIAGACDRSRAAMLRKLIRDADVAQKNPPVASALAGVATSGSSQTPANEIHPQERNADFTPTPTD